MKPGKTVRCSINGGSIMKKLFPVLVMTLMANLAFAETFTAPMVPRKAPPSQKPPPLPPRQTGGVTPRAIRGAHPLQRLNPLAPARYGTAQQCVAMKPDGSAKLIGMKLFEFTF